MAIRRVWYSWILPRPLIVCDHSILLTKLPCYAWCERFIPGLVDYSYLHIDTRQQRVRLNNGFSNWGEITHGVPQGSILGLLLFCHYVSDLPSVIQKSRTHLFAHDTSIHCNSHSANEVENSLQHDMAAVCTWMNSNKLKLNHTKTVVMLIGT